MKKKEIRIEALDYLFCQHCKTPLMTMSFVINQAWHNRTHTPYGLSIHYIRCENCHQKWAIIILADDEAWGFLQTEAENAKQLYKRVLELRKKGVSIIGIRNILFAPAYIS